MHRKLARTAKPSSGLEPETPSLPWNFSGNRSQPVATDLACFCGFRGSPICRRLPSVATTELHKGSILATRSLIGTETAVHHLR